MPDLLPVCLQDFLRCCEPAVREVPQREVITSEHNKELSAVIPPRSDGFPYAKISLQALSSRKGKSILLTLGHLIQFLSPHLGTAPFPKRSLPLLNDIVYYGGTYDTPLQTQRLQHRAGCFQRQRPCGG